MSSASESLDFRRFHTEELPELLRDGRGAEAARAASGAGSLAFRLQSGDAFTYLPAGGESIEVRAGDDDADTVVELSDEDWRGVVLELDAAAGLLYGGRAKCPRGNAMKWMIWEPALRALYNGRPFYDPAGVDLKDAHGQPLDPARSFTLNDDRKEMAHFLRTCGYLVVRGVFDADEIARFLDEADELRGEAVKGDKLSWWGKNARGEEVLCRVTRAGAKPALRSIPHDSRIVGLKDLADEPLEHRASDNSEAGVSVVIKNPDMTEGLSDIPWHRDCGMGGHAVMCPVLIASTYLTPATPETGELKMLPGSWRSACAPIDANHPAAPRGVSFAMQPGDVSLHYGDTMHAAPPPSRSDLDGYRISAITGFTRPGARHHRGGKSYNDVLHGREDGQVEHLSKVARRR